MDKDWISAHEAIEFLRRVAPLTDQQKTICSRAHAGLIEARAETLVLPSKTHKDANIAKEFWWAEGKHALEQNWITGDFSTWIDEKYEIKAFGVSFKADEIYKIIPGENPELRTWISSKEAVLKVSAEAGVNNDAALASIIRCCEKKLVSSRCEKMEWRIVDRYDSEHHDEIIKDSIPIWFWNHCANGINAINNWKNGNFAAHGYLDDEEWTESNAYEVSFEQISLDNAIEYATPLKKEYSENSSEKILNSPSETDQGDKAPLSDAELNNWWENKFGVRDSLTKDELLTLVRAKFPDKHISRDRVRDLIGPRKTGPKPFGGKIAAK